jgi:hypothetical protein
VCSGGVVLWAYDLGIMLSTTWSTLKLAALARGGNSLKLSIHLPTSICAGTSKKAWSALNLS